MKKLLFKNFPHLLHGADYNPEQWKGYSSVLEDDMRLMKKAGMNEMTVGIFAWAELEPEEGQFDFSFFDGVLDRVLENGGRVLLSTPSAARPKWLADRYPEVLRVNDRGERMRFGGRHNHCLTSPVYRAKVAEINRRLAERYASHPAVIGYHISNEYSGECFCPLCVAAFRDFLRERYQNDIERLNHAYWARFWSHTYRSFDEVEPPSSIGEQAVHGLNLDWRRFVSHQTADFMRAEIAALRAGGATQPMTINMMPGVRDTNYAEYADSLDLISWDSYPDWHGPDHVGAAVHTAFWHDYFRALKQKPFLLMESAPGLTNWKPVNKLKRPGMERLSALQAVAHGSDSVQYFQFRKSRGSSEKLHGAVVDHCGSDQTRIFGEVAAIGRTLAAIDGVAGMMPAPRVAVIYDLESRWAISDAQGLAHGGDKGYLAACLSCYRPFFARGIAVDVISPNADLSRYDLVVAPMLYMVKSDTVSRLSRFVREGGTLYATYTLGMVDESDLCYLGGFPAGELKEVFGIWNEEVDTLYPEERSGVTMGDRHYEGDTVCELIHARGAAVLATYDRDFYAGRPALTCNRYGKGKAYYQAFRDRGDFCDTVLGQIAAELSLPRALDATLPEGVTAHTRSDGTTTYLFVENYSGTPVTLPLDHAMTDAESGAVTDSVALDAFDVRIFKNTP